MCLSYKSRELHYAFGGAAPDVAPLCENMVCTGRPGHRQAPQRLICRHVYEDRSLRVASHIRVPANKNGLIGLSRLITWSVSTVADATIFHRTVRLWPHAQHIEHVVRIDVVS